MGSYASVGAHIKTGKSPMAHDHFQTPPDPKKGYTNPKCEQTIDKCPEYAFYKKFRAALRAAFTSFWIIFWIFMALLGVRRGSEMILSFRAPSSLNMSSYRAIWTHFRLNFIFFWPKQLRLPKIQTFPKMQISSSSHSHKYLTYMGR